MNSSRSWYLHIALTISPKTLKNAVRIIHTKLLVGNAVMISRATLINTYIEQWHVMNIIIFVVAINEKE